MRNRVRNLIFLSCSFNPDLIWIFRNYVLTFHELLIQYWPRFDHFELSGGAPCRSMSYSFNIDFILTTLNFQDVPRAIWRFIHWMFISFQPFWIVSSCVLWFHALMILYWPRFVGFDDAGLSRLDLCSNMSSSLKLYPRFTSNLCVTLFLGVFSIMTLLQWLTQTSMHFCDLPPPLVHNFHFIIHYLLLVSYVRDVDCSRSLSSLIQQSFNWCLLWPALGNKTDIRLHWGNSAEAQAMKVLLRTISLPRLHMTERVAMRNPRFNLLRLNTFILW